MTDGSQLDTLDTPQPERSSSSAPPSLALNLSAAAVSLATIGAITVLCWSGRVVAPWWGWLGSLLIAGMAASERARLLTAAIKRSQPKE